ncbi:MAG: NCS2 family permease [Clostridia bacterium]|nr:NCS2 family permease [Clostridia bacterium]
MNFLQKFFKLKENNTTVRTEVIAGITTFITMAYIIFVNPDILKMAGMNASGALGDKAAQFNAFNDPVVGAVLVATCLSAAIGTLIMGLYANYPFAQAPGMGLNAFFTFTVVLGMGYTWQQALTAVFISGIIFIIITITRLRESIVKAIPMTLKYAVSGGIGLFIALIGFKNAGIVAGNPSTIIAFGNLTSPKTLLAIFGLIITGLLVAKNVKGSMLIGIFITTVAGIVTDIISIPKGFTVVSAPPSISPTFWQFDFSGLLKLGDNANLFSTLVTIAAIVLSFTLVDLFDTIGTLIGTGSKAGMLDKEGKLPRINKALLSDSIATTTGAVLGTSTVVTYVESASGVMEGGRTGLTSVVTSILFLLALFFAPVAGLVPSEATAPALIIVGVFMMGALRHINFDDFTEALPAFLTVVMMPFTFSIANGIASGLIVYPIVKIATGKGKTVHPLVYILAVLFILRFIAMAKYGA